MNTTISAMNQFLSTERCTCPRSTPVTPEHGSPATDTYEPSQTTETSGSRPVGDMIKGALFGIPVGAMLATAFASTITGGMGMALFALGGGLIGGGLAIYLTPKV